MGNEPSKLAWRSIDEAWRDVFRDFAGEKRSFLELLPAAGITVEEKNDFITFWKGNSGSGTKMFLDEARGLAAEI